MRLYSLLLALLAAGLASSPGAAQVRQADQTERLVGHPSRVVAIWTSDGVWIIGHLVETLSGEPLDDAQVFTSITGVPVTGVLTDSLGWFQILEPLRDVHELGIEKLGYTKTVVRLTPEADEEVFFVQNRAIAPCERIRSVGETLEPNRVVLRLRDWDDGRPITGIASVSVRRFGVADVLRREIPVEEGTLPLPIEEGGVYSVTVGVPGFVTWEAGTLIIPFDQCDENRMQAVEVGLPLVSTSRLQE